ncbi:MAG: D-alanyl-D-alanine carboxypeptidase, partial [Actinomycetales bacterium]|nr:D-alanyl-D-alanine carboxypeptidase [Actinomycetales bacterium]
MARSRPRARRRRALGAVLVLILLGLVSGYVALDIRDVVPGVLTDDPPWLDADPFPTASLPSVPTAEEVLSGPSPTAPLPTADGLAALSAPVLADPRVGPDSGVLVTDVLTGADLFTATPQTARVPASTLKILVAVAALETMGDQRTFTTRVMNGADGEVVLVGGGDMMLASDAGDAGAVVGHAGLGDLADQVAEELSAEGRSTTRVVLDDSLFTGPRLGPNWGAADVNGGWAMPIMPIAVDIGIVEGRTVRESDPALAAAGAFAQALAARGITVQGA